MPARRSARTPDPAAASGQPPVTPGSLAAVRDGPSLLAFLRDTLDWPLDNDSVEDVSYTWTDQDLRDADLGRHVVDGRILQVANLHDRQPWGVFVIEFTSDEAFRAERGMTGTLRRILRGLVPSRRRDATQPAWKREHLLFICTHRYEHFRVAYFKNPPAGSKTPPLAAFGWGPDIHARTACEFNLPALAWPDDPADPAAWTLAWASAFDVAKVTKRFYQDYAREDRKLRQAVAPSLGETDIEAEPVKMFVQSLLNRLMFLRFIERKGWLTAPGDEQSRDYLRLLFQAGGHQGKSFYAGRLKPLFFEALAVEGRQSSDAVGTVPLLNGGLFEESDLDRKVGDIPDAAFAPLLEADGLLYRYNFTVQESTPLDVEVAVDPEMLGKVFEELVTGRHESGSYYTPRPVVSFMCREALKGYLADATGIDAGKLAAFVDKHDVRGIALDGAKRIIDALDRLRAVDPACGSGAYLLGLLHEIVDLYRLLYSDKLKADARELNRIKLDIIQNSLYGVDIDPFATNIAMLRLWLSLIVDCETPEPLPNLDFKIETGDSLTGPNPQDMPDLMRVNLDEKARQLAIIKGQYMRARGGDKQSLRRLILKEQGEIAFELRSLSPGSIDWRVQFCEVFFSDRKGFDIVLANPPYVRKENIPPEIKGALQSNYKDAITGRSDLYCSFYARAMQLLRSGGIQVFICSSAWLDAEYGAPLQNYFLRDGVVLAVYDSSVERQFSTANVNTIISVIRKGREGRQKTPARFTLMMAPFDAAVFDSNHQRVVVVQQDVLRSLGMKDRKYVGDKWGGKYLRAPDIYKRLINAGKGLLIQLGDISNVVGYIHDNNTGEGHPKRTVLWKVSDTDVIRVNKATKGVREVGVSPIGNSTLFVPVLFARQHGLRHIVLYCEDGVLGKEFYRIIPHKGWKPLALAAQLNSTFAILQREILGIKGFGGGALKFAARDVELFEVVDGIDQVRLESLMAKMLDRPIEYGEEEWKQSDRQAIDNMIFDALSLSAEDRRGVYEAVDALLELRKVKAASRPGR